MQELFACKLIAAVGNDLVRVHVRLRAGAGLPDDQRKMLQKRAGNDLVGRLLDHSQLFRRHFLGLQLVVGLRRRFFQDAERMDDLLRHGLDADADGEILMAAFRLCAPVFVGGDFDLSHGVMLDPVFHFLAHCVSSNKKFYVPNRYNYSELTGKQKC